MAKSGNSYLLREFNVGDYKEFCSWWGNDQPPPLESLPTIGLVCGEGKAVGFLANTDTNFAIITWWHASPYVGARDKYNALVQTIKGLVEAAALIGKKNVFIYTTNRGMIRLLESLGFDNHDGHLILRF